MTKTNVALALDGVLHRDGMRDVLRSGVFAGVDELVAHHFRQQEWVRRKPELAALALAASKEAKPTVDTTPLICASPDAPEKEIAVAAAVIAEHRERVRRERRAPGAVTYFSNDGSHVFIEGASAHPLVQPSPDLKCAALSALYGLMLHDEPKQNKVQPVITADDFTGLDAALRWHLYELLKLSWREPDPIGIPLTAEDAARMWADVEPYLEAQLQSQEGQPSAIKANRLRELADQLGVFAPAAISSEQELREVSKGSTIKPEESSDVDKVYRDHWVHLQELERIDKEIQAIIGWVREHRPHLLRFVPLAASLTSTMSDLAHGDMRNQSQEISDELRKLAVELEASAGHTAGLNPPGDGTATAEILAGLEAAAGAVADLKDAHGKGMERVEELIASVGARDDGGGAEDRMTLPNLGPHDRDAWQLMLIPGMTQTKAAAELNKQFPGESWSQPRVSEACARAKAHAVASGLAGKIATQRSRAPARTLDPAVADEGQRTDGWAKHLREKARQIAKEE